MEEGWFCEHEVRVHAGQAAPCAPVSFECNPREVYQRDPRVVLKLTVSSHGQRVDPGETDVLLSLVGVPRRLRVPCALTEARCQAGDRAVDVLVFHEFNANELFRGAAKARVPATVELRLSRSGASVRREGCLVFTLAPSLDDRCKLLCISAKAMCDAGERTLRSERRLAFAARAMCVAAIDKKRYDLVSRLADIALACHYRLLLHELAWLWFGECVNAALLPHFDAAMSRLVANVAGAPNSRNAHAVVRGATERDPTIHGTGGLSTVRGASMHYAVRQVLEYLGCDFATASQCDEWAAQTIATVATGWMTHRRYMRRLAEPTPMEIAAEDQAERHSRSVVLCIMKKAVVELPSHAQSRDIAVALRVGAREAANALASIAGSGRRPRLAAQSIVDLFVESLHGVEISIDRATMGEAVRLLVDAPTALGERPPILRSPTDRATKRLRQERVPLGGVDESARPTTVVIERDSQMTDDQAFSLYRLIINGRDNDPNAMSAMGEFLAGVTGKNKEVHMTLSVDGRTTRVPSPLHVACALGKLSMVKVLVNRGFSLETIDRKGRSPFHYAARHGRLEVVQWLWEHFGRVATFTAVDHRGLDALALRKRVILDNERLMFCPGMHNVKNVEDDATVHYLRATCALKDEHASTDDLTSEGFLVITRMTLNFNNLTLSRE